MWTTFRSIFLIRENHDLLIEQNTAGSSRSVNTRQQDTQTQRKRIIFQENLNLLNIRQLVDISIVLFVVNIRRSMRI